MNGISSAQNPSPSSGNQISCCLIKNLRSGIRRFNATCNTTMSTHVWWLASTRYQPFLSSNPAFSAHQSREPEPLSASPFTAIQFSAHHISQRVSTRRTATIGRNSFSNASVMIGTNQNAVLTVSMPNVSTPRVCLTNDLTCYLE